MGIRASHGGILMSEDTMAISVSGGKWDAAGALLQCRQWREMIYYDISMNLPTSSQVYTLSPTSSLTRQLPNIHLPNLIRRSRLPHQEFRMRNLLPSMHSVSSHINDNLVHWLPAMLQIQA